MQRFLPNFKTTYTLIGTTFILLSVSLFAKGLIPSMAAFQVPAVVLQSPHYFDALLWVYVHMTVIGILLVCLGQAVNDQSKQQWITALLCCIMAFYTYLDFRSSDSALGNALYKGESSVAPAFIGLLVSLLLLQLLIRLVWKRVS